MLRGRRDGDGVVTALTIVQCGKDQNPATRVRILGYAPKDLCDDIKAVPLGNESSIGGAGRVLWGRAIGWIGIEFAQIVGNHSFSAGWPPAIGDSAKAWGVTNFGAVFHNEDGKNVVFAPGEIVKVSDRVSFVAKPGMDADELKAILAAASNAVQDALTGQKTGPPVQAHGRDLS